ncbi:MAG: thiosulfate/3-mercaptopyruvate sulfurtransferase [Thermomicrobiales bacterium]|nr:thiosulfate/3-mercaptopyruvate sulfurtransferase [Thermomicrobiales bacterium]
MMLDLVSRRPFSRRDLGRTLLGSTLVGAGCVACGGSLPIAPAATVGPFPGQPAAPLLVDAGWLQAQTQNRDQRLLILDLSALRRYRRGHIPGAVHAWWQDTMERDDGVYGTTLQPINFTDQTKRIHLLEDLGIDDEIHVVCYDDDRGRWAARMVWFLRFLGHDRASALDGGLAAWRGDGGATGEGEVDPPETPTPTVAPRTGYYIGDEDLAEWRTDPRTLLLDVRTDDEARDDVNDSLPIGRIPGAISWPWTSSLRDETGRLKSPEEISAALTALGATPDRRIVLYARFGVEAAQSWLVLALMGYSEFLIYDRGWAGWATSPGNEFAPL